MNRPQVKRVYDPPGAADGCRVLVDRLWPRGLTKASAAIDHWLRDIAPSNELRQWYQHDAAKWDEFRRRYFAELDGQEALVNELRELCAAGPVTLLFGSRELTLNNAVALREYLQRRADDGAG